MIIKVYLEGKCPHCEQHVVITDGYIDTTATGWDMCSSSVPVVRGHCHLCDNDFVVYPKIFPHEEPQTGRAETKAAYE